MQSNGLQKPSSPVQLGPTAARQVLDVHEAMQQSAAELLRAVEASGAKVCAELRCHDYMWPCQEMLLVCTLFGAFREALCRADMETLRASCNAGNQQVARSLAELQASTTQAIRTTTSGLEAVERRLDRVEAQVSKP